MGQDFPAAYFDKWKTSLPDEAPEEEPFPSIEEIEQAEAEDDELIYAEFDRAEAEAQWEQEDETGGEA